MRILLQRVTQAQVNVDDRTVGAIGPGLLLLVGISSNDGEEVLEALAEKITNLRIFEDAEGRMNLSIRDLLTSGESMGILVVSQFTLYGDIRKGRRPSFGQAAAPEIARPLVDRFAERLAETGASVECGEFGAHMQVSLVNDGPVTIWLDSDDLGQSSRGRHA